LHYSRLKTKGPVSIKVIPEAIDIIEKYKGDKYLLDFLLKDSYSAFKGLTRTVNEDLRKAGLICGIDYLTTYYARRSWASLASKLKIPIEVIDRALGHNSKQLIFRYVDYDLERIDEANGQVIRSLD
jgi:integrase